MLAGAQAKLAADKRLAERVSLVRGRSGAAAIPDGEFDHLTFTYLLRYVDDPGATMRELARVVKPGGRIASLEFAVPSSVRCGEGCGSSTREWGFRCWGRLVSREWAHTGRFLADSIPGFYERYPIARVVELWEQAGIVDVHVRSMSFGGGVVMWGTRGADGSASRLSARPSTRCARVGGAIS